MSRITTPFGFATTAREVVDGVDLSARRAIVTGASSGIGGRYFVDCNETDVVDARSGTLDGVARYAIDPDNASRLWDVSDAMVAQASSTLAEVL